MAKKLTHAKISWDWKSGPSFKDLQAALKPFGVHVAADPGLQGTDSFGYVLSSRPLTKAELENVAEAEE